MPKNNKQLPVLKTLPEVGFIRLPQVLQFIPVSVAGWYAGMAEGIYPRPVKLSKRLAVWRVQDIRALIERLSGAGGE